MFNFHQSRDSKTKTFVIAEIGINHNGDLDQAKKLIEEAKNCGASSAKLQTYITEKRTSKDSPIYEILKKCELSFEDQIKLFNSIKNILLVKLKLCFSPDFHKFWSNSYSNSLHAVIS